VAASSKAKHLSPIRQPAKRPLWRTTESNVRHHDHRDSNDIFVLVGGVKIAKRRSSGTAKPALGYRSSRWTVTKRRRVRRRCVLVH